VLGSLIGLLLLAFVVLYAIGSVKWNKLHGKYQVPSRTISPTDADAIARRARRYDPHAGIVTWMTWRPICRGANHANSLCSKFDRRCWRCGRSQHRCRLVRFIRHGVGQDGRGWSHAFKHLVPP
jgi:hypothetical protein